MQISQIKPHTGKIYNIHHWDKSDQMDIQATFNLKEILKSNQIGRQTTRNRYPQEAQHILQWIEQEISMGYIQTGSSNHSLVAPKQWN